jgi:hypothetical protein
MGRGAHIQIWEHDAGEMLSPRRDVEDADKPRRLTIAECAELRRLLAKMEPPLTGYFF